MPIILIGLAIAAFLIFANPLYSDVGVLRTEVSTYNQALDSSKELDQERDKLTKKYNDIGDNVDKIQKFLPDNVDNIRLILEIGHIAQPYGMVLKDVKYNASTDTASQAAAPNGIQGGIVKEENKDYGTWDLEFSTTGSYENFLNFTRDLQSNLRIVDISSISFSSTDNGTGLSSNGAGSDVYKYVFKIKTYWLKN